ncbi:hypothetical protein EJ05DRAFT_478185 [Pseudovirgaria hyperparasitica]|uniref:FUN14-domain-containing protein n=1 Tax=Pseudovirgaria hyperparasitica TaxID=470096 RepID=A0A6A6W528_9PEZI|nr:uncharacterized protein EJ05DRAFT_478185 [Pseudovirgaria hyperparasitica]KAF2756161.1 hypothetical protein EJ05DRAFT_478185 [Pseudovirgaria hyperparasitica]
MASRTFNPLLHRPRALRIGLTSLCAGGLVATPLLRPTKYYCDASPTPLSSRDWTRNSSSGLPPPENFISAKNIKQISTGSILGLLGGVVISMFSKTLTLLIGVGIVLVQFLESRGIPIVPYGQIQKMAKNVDIQGAMQRNVALKLSFGITFALAAFAGF